MNNPLAHYDSTAEEILRACDSMYTLTHLLQMESSIIIWASSRENLS